MTGHNKTILLVEDEVLIAKAEARTLGKHGYKVIMVHSGEDAVDSMKKNSDIDLVLMDIDLGRGIDGTQAAEMILKERDVPVVFLLSHTEPEVVEKTERITSYGYVVKNAGESVLLASLRMAFRLHNADMRIHEQREELIKREKELADSREEFIGYFRMSTVGMCVTSVEKGWLEVNDRLCAMLGYSREELAGLTWAELTYPDDLQADVALFDRLLDGEIEEYELEKRFVRKDGLIIHTMLYVTCKRNDDRSVRHVLASLIDITRRKRVEDEMERVSRLFHLITENMTEGVVLADMNMNVEYGSPSTLKRNGFSLEEFKSIPLERRMTGESYERLMKSASEELTPEHLSDPEYNISRMIMIEYFRKDGSTYWSESSFRILRDDSGRPSGILSVGRDITERKKMEEALRESEKRYRDLVENANSIILRMDAKGKVLFFNDFAQRFFGFTQDEIIGRNVLGTIVPSRDMTGKDLEEMIREIGVNPDRYVSNENENMRRDGTRVWVSWTNRGMLNDRGEVDEILCIGNDTTERKKAEERLVVVLRESDILREKAERLNREKELLLKEVHHRIKNNMSAVMSILSLQVRTLTDSAAIEAINGAKNRVQSMMVLYDRLYRSDDFKNLSTREYIPLLVEEIVDIFVSDGAVTVEMEIDDIVLPAKKLIPLGILINELISNAIKHAFNGRRGGRIGISLMMRNGRIRVVIEDNGTGIPEGITPADSTGFGLQLVSLLVQQLSGEITIDREKGTKFVLEFSV